MKIISLATGILFLLNCCAAFGQTPPSTEWAITDVILPLDPPGDEDAAWQVAYAHGDFLGNGKCDFSITGNIDFPPGNNPPWLYPFNVSPGLGEANCLELTLDPFTAPVNPYSGWWQPHFVFLEFPGGTRVGTLDEAWGSVVVYDFDTRQYLGTVPFPTPPPGIPQMHSVEGIYPAGDINFDGYDDMFVQGQGPQNYKFVAMIDGASLTMPWAHYEPEGYSNFFPTQSGELDVPKDLNGDGAADFVSTFDIYHVAAQRFESIQVANSGVDGTVLWENRRWDTTLLPGAIGGRDVNGNGTPDYHTTTAYSVRMVDGVDGSTIWDIPREYMSSLYPPAQYEIRQENPSFFTGVVGDPSGIEFCQYIYGWEISSIDTFHGIAHLDAATGSFLSFEELPSDLEPWYPDSMAFAPQNIMSLMGDIDRDGYTEIFYNPPVAEGNSAAIYGDPRPGIIFSPKTLFTPPTQPIGSTMSFTASVPSSPGRLFALLISDIFDRDDGLMLGEWRTHLGDSRILDWSMSTWNLFGSLNPYGEGTVTVSVPPNPALSGRTLYSRAVVFENWGSSEIWTISTLGVTELY